MAFKLVNGDIVTMKVDALVNATNTSLKMGGGVCGAIFRAAGAIDLQNACNMIAPIDTGQAVITNGFNLPASYIIHTAGPIYNMTNQTESQNFLRNSYYNSLQLAREYGLYSIAFPLISAGIYGYPKDEAFKIAKETIEKFLEDNDMEIYITIIDEDFFNKVNNI